MSLDECIDLAITYIYQGNPGLARSPTDLKTLFSFATAETHFLFKGVFHDQTDGVAMGSPLAPVLANLFMGHHEKNWLIDNFSSSQVLFYRPYVDDTFRLFNNEEDALMFFDYINTRHPSICFTMEREIDKKLPFLDILLDNSHPSIVTSVRKGTLFKCLVDLALEH